MRREEAFQHLLKLLLQTSTHLHPYLANQLRGQFLRTEPHLSRRVRERNAEKVRLPKKLLKLVAATSSEATHDRRMCI